MGIIIAVILSALAIFLVVRWWNVAFLVFIAFGFLFLGPTIFYLNVSVLPGSIIQNEKAEVFFQISAWLPPLLSFVWFIIRYARYSGSFLLLIKSHVLYKQPIIAIFVGATLSVFLVIGLEVDMAPDEVLNMSLFAMIVFIICAWFLPLVLGPMFAIKGRSSGASEAISTVVGLMLSLLIALGAFKARERFAELDTAINVLVDMIVSFLVAALAGAGAVLAIQKTRARYNNDES